MAGQGLSPGDPSSYSRPELAIVTNVYISLEVNFPEKILSGNVDLTIKRKDESVNEVILDSKNLKVHEIYEAKLNKKLNFSLTEPFEEFGSKLTVELPPKDSNEYVISIRYETSPTASGLQWLTPDQTAGKVHPYLFSQFQPIDARSVIPCQDTPSVKTKYSAVIAAPSELTVLMSAIFKDKKVMPGGRTLYHYVQNVPVQSYLIAIAVGALESREISPRCKVWSERDVVDAAQYEFADTEKQLKAAEDLCGPYVWGRYDLLVLPPSFPFGGMENPCLTFVTPTLLSGDRSLANVVAHEIAHSWTGNLVTNKNFEHFWLNEGFTVFIERRIIARLESVEAQDFQALCGLDDLKETIDHLGANNSLTSLVVDLKNNVHPDDSFSKVPYEKGSLFLRYLESVVGGPEQFEPFLRRYFDTYKFKSISTDDFKAFFEKNFKDVEAIKSVDWSTWLYAPGMPPVVPNYLKDQVMICDELKSKILNNGNVTQEEVQSLTSMQIVHILHHVAEEGPKFPVDKLIKLQELFGLKKVQNSEIRFRWYRLCLKSEWEDIVPEVLEWISEVGRMKFVRPLYRDLYKFELARPKAIANFLQYKNTMMHVSAYTVAQDLHLK